MTPMIPWWWLIPASIVPGIIGMVVIYKVSWRYFTAIVVVHYRAQGLNEVGVEKRLAQFFDDHKMTAAFNLVFDGKEYKRWLKGRGRR